MTVDEAKQKKWNMPLKEIALCADCGNPERLEWFVQQKHICGGIITDPNSPMYEGMYLKVGKKRFFKIVF